jgi:hypothetical protein
MQPYEDRRNHHYVHVLQALRDGVPPAKNLPVEEGTPQKDLAVIIQLTWERDPLRRPSMLEFLRYLEDIERSNLLEWIPQETGTDDFDSRTVTYHGTEASMDLETGLDLFRTLLLNKPSRFGTPNTEYIRKCIRCSAETGYSLL